MRKAVRSAVVAVLAFVVVAMPSIARADGRVALVVGNSTYAHIGRLSNPDNDARDISAALRRLGFEVTTEFEADRVELTEALRAFTRRSAGADVSLVFYAGHGIEMDGVNYLVPVDARLERDIDVRFETVTVDDLLVSTAVASLRLLILDACRNNPLARSMRRTAAFRSVSGGSFADLNEDLLGDETLVAYAAAAGTTAADGRGRNSPYTSALLAHLEEPPEWSALFRPVRAQVLEATNGEQRAHEYASLLREHYLQGAAGPGTVVVAAVGSADMRARQEMVFWQSISNSADPADFQAYLEEVRTAPSRVWPGTAWRRWRRTGATRRRRNVRSPTFPRRRLSTVRGRWPEVESVTAMTVRRWQWYRPAHSGWAASRVMGVGTTNTRCRTSRWRHSRYRGTK